MEEELFTIEINSELFDKDYDEVGYEPEVVDDSDAEMAKQLGY